jgi:chitodextrinase
MWGAALRHRLLPTLVLAVACALLGSSADGPSAFAAEGLAAPTISSFSPSRGAIGSTVTINGSGFTGATQVSLCLVPTTYTVLSATTVTATVPAGACDGLWRVTTPAGTGVSGLAFTSTSPTLSTFSPSTGGVGSTVTISGTNFTGATQVSLCLVQTTFTLVSATTVRAAVPSGACDGRWRITTAAGTAASDQTFTVTQGSLAITGFSPATGAVGSTVTINGSGFNGATQVSLCLVPTTFTLVSATTITAAVPSGACDGLWRVTTSAGTAASGNYFTVATGSFSISGFSPASGAIGSTVTINGSGFTAATDVSLCLVPTNFTVLSATTLTATVPPDACDGRWRVTTPAGTAASNGVFTNTSPTVATFSPASGPVGTIVTVSGTNFTGATQVSLCLVATTFTVVSATKVTAAVPSGACDGRWRVTTGNGTGVSDGVFTNMAGPVDTTPPSPVSGLHKAGATPTSITLAWNAATDDVGVAGYSLYKGGVKIDSTTGLSYTYTGLNCGTTYTLGVETFDAAGNVSDLAYAISVQSTNACAADMTPPSTPTGLQATGSTQSTIALSWNASTDNVAVTGYGIYVNGSLWGSSAGTSFTVAGLACGTTFTLGVDATDAATNRSATTSISASTPACTGPPPPTGSVFVSPGGSDSNSCSQVAPCATFDRAYHVAAPGQAVDVAAGSYPDQNMTGDSSKTGPGVVTFRPQGGTVTLAGLWLEGTSYVNFTNLVVNGQMRVQNTDYTSPGSTNVTFTSMTAKTVRVVGRVANVTIHGGSYGSTVDGQPQVKKYDLADPASAQPVNTLVEDAVFHDFRRSGGSVHTECFQIMNANGLILRRNKFYNCDGTGDLGLTCFPGTTGITVENNWIMGGGDTGYGAQISGDCSNLNFRYNSSTQSVFFSDTSVAPPYRFVGNYMPFHGTLCDKGATHSHNVYEGGTCSSTDINVSSLNFIGGFDLHLGLGSAAINAGDAGSFPATDIDGEARPRGSGPDAGADEAG